MASTVSTIQAISELPGQGQILTPYGTKLEPIVFSSTASTVSNMKQEHSSVTEISPAIAMTDSELAYFHLVKFILRSHDKLTQGDIAYAANYISSFYAHSFDILQTDPNVPGILNDEQLIMFLVYADRRGICKFALTFNEEVDFVIKNRDAVSLKKILLGPKEMFIELYDNTFLSTNDRDFIIRLIAREMFATNLTLESLKNKMIDLETIGDTCKLESLTIHADKKDNEMAVVSVATKCYEEVCIQDAKILEDDVARATMSKYEKTSDSVYTVDKPATSSTPQVYCFNTLDLIAAVIEDIPMNPKTNEPFSEYSLKVINQRFHKEISMYRRYVQLKSTTIKN